jgi:hypothetical protein
MYGNNGGEYAAVYAGLPESADLPAGNRPVYPASVSSWYQSHLDNNAGYDAYYSPNPAGPMANSAGNMVPNNMQSYYQSLQTASHLYDTHHHDKYDA